MNPLNKTSLLIALTVAVGIGYSQNPDDKIDFKNFNHSFLAELINQQINALRDSIKAPKLTKDSILELAAKNHAVYILKSDQISHLQPDPLFANLEKRVEYFKGTQEKLSEIIEVIYIDKPTQIYKKKETIKIYTYGEAADFYIQNSINTSDHYEILTQKHFYTTAIAFAVNPDRKCIYVVNVFGSRAFKPHHMVKHKTHKKTFYPSKKINIDNAYGIKPYDDKVCAKCVEKFQSIPDYVSYGLKVENNKIYFHFSNLEWFEKVFNEGSEAIAADVLHLDQYPCNDGNMLHRSPVHDGILFRPFSKSEILKNNLRKDENAVWVYLGDCPYTNPNEYNLSLLLINNNTLCGYYINSPPVNATTGLIETEFYSDTLSKSEISKNKNLRFSIPFEKAKSEYSEKDIKPFYDSLHLNKFDIKELVIIAYSSVEGSTEKNSELQKKRAQSIVKVLQSSQMDSIKTTIKTLENWDQFYREIKNTPYAYLASLDKATIKEKLKQDSLLTALEPILKRHRKAFVTLKVEKKIDLTKNKSELIPHYKTALAKKDFANASALQASLFDAVMNKEISYGTMENISIPKSKEYAQLINNDIIFRYNNGYEMDYVKALEEVSALDPSNVFIKFNLYNMQLLNWYKDPSSMNNPDPLIKNIKTLFNTKIDKKLANQLYLNYYILVSDYYKNNQKYKYRDQAVDIVKKYHKTFDATQKDILTLANYFVRHGRRDYSIEILTPYIQSGEYSEDMLFFYLSLIQSDIESYERYSTVALMKRASEMNKTRFCKLFGEETLHSNCSKMKM
ncbi:MAG: hypothetical protein NZ529_05600 [Cytophagaceae bacterium]|nr:hypothetical protein [Cytophagaceae bacterium]MDW8456251.1 hypothetical protein [Cytophagaceae bacterium]